MIWLHKSVGRKGMWIVSTTSECSPIKTYHDFLRPIPSMARRRDGVTKAAKRHLLLFQLVRLMITQFPLNWMWAENMEYFLTPDQGAYSIKTNPISSSCEWVIGKELTSLWLLYMRHRMLRSRWMLCARPARRDFIERRVQKATRWLRHHPHAKRRTMTWIGGIALSWKWLLLALVCALTFDVVENWFGKCSRNAKTYRVRHFIGIAGQRKCCHVIFVQFKPARTIGTITESHQFMLHSSNKRYRIAPCVRLLCVS